MTRPTDREPQAVGTAGARRPPRRGGAIRARRLAVLAVIALSGLLLGLHTPPVRSLVLHYAVAAAEERCACELQIEDLRYNLSTLSAELRNVSTAARATPDRPFASAEVIGLRFGGRTLLGDPQLREVMLRAPRISMTPDTVRSVVPPAGPTESGGSVTRLPTLDVRDLDLTIGFGQARVAMRGVSLRLARGAESETLHGRFDAPAGTRVELGGMVLDFAAVTATASLDGAALTVRDLDAVGPAATLSVQGAIDVADDDAQLDLGITASTDLAVWSDAVPGFPMPNGAAHVTARVTGSGRHPRVDFEIEAPALSTPALGPIAARASGRWNDGTLALAPFDVEGAGGEVRTMVALSRNEGSAAIQGTVDWTELDVARLIAGVFGDAPRLNGLATSGTGTLIYRGGAQPRFETDSTVEIHTGSERFGARLRATRGAADWRIELDSLEAPAASLVQAFATIRTDGPRWQDHAVDGELVLQVPDIGTLLGDLDAAGVSAFARNLPDPATTEGAVRVTGGVTGTIRRPRVAGLVELDGGAVAGTPVLDGTAQVSVDVSTATTTGTLRARTRDLASWAMPGLGPDAVVGGTAELSAAWSGPLVEPRLTFSVESRDLIMIGLGAARIRADGRVSPRLVEVDTFALTQSSGGLLSASGRYDLGSQVVAVRGDGRGFRITIPHPDDGGRPAAELRDGTVSISVTGPRDRLNGAGRLAAWSVIGGSEGPVDADLTFDEGVLHAGVHGSGIGLTTEVALTMAAPWMFSGQGRLTGLPLSRVLPLVGIAPAESNAGTLDGTWAFSGDLDDPGATVANFEVAPLETRLFGVAVRTPAPWQIEFADRQLRLDAAEIIAGGVRTRFEGVIQTDRPDGYLHLDIDGDLDGWAGIDDGPEDDRLVVDGTVDGRLELRRTESGTELAGTLETFIPSVRRGERSLTDEIRATLEFDGTRALLRELTVAPQGIDASATATVPLAWANEWLPATWHFRHHPTGPAAIIEASLSSSVVSLIELAGLVPDESVQGGLAVETRLTATRPRLDTLSGEIRLTRAELTTEAVNLAQLEPTVLGIDGSRLAIDMLRWQGSGATVAAGGGIDFGDGDSRVDVEVDGDLRLVDALLPGRLTGRVAGTATVERRSGRWRGRGRARVIDGYWLLQDAQLLFAGWSGQIDASDDGVVLSAVEGRINDGQVRLSGRLPVGMSDQAQRVTIAAENVLLNVPEGLSSQLSAALDWQRGPGAVPELRGTVTVTANRYSEPITRMLELVDALAAGTGATAAPRAPGPMAETRLDVALVVTDPIVIENSFGLVELIPDLRLVGALGAPALTGEIDALEDSRLQIGGRTYRLRDSSLSFSPTTGLLPTFNAVGETTVGDYDVELRISGRADRIETTYLSSPPLSPRELQLLLFTGRTGRAGSEEETADALAAASGDVLGFAGRFVGLDSVRLGTAADLDLISRRRNTDQHLTMSRSFGRQFEVIVSDNLETGAFSWVLVVRPFTGYEVRLASFEGSDQSVEFRQEILFGPGGPPAVQGSQEAAPAAIVDRVEISGDPGFARAELAGVLRMRPGDRFDVRRWTEDRLRLDTFYRDRGYHRVRIVPTRSTGQDTGTRSRVALRYEIERGPMTTIELTGDSLSGDALDTMYDAWRGIPIPDVLASEFERIARRDLYRRRYYRPEVRVDFLSVSDDLARVRVHVTRGPRIDRQQIRWSGHRVVSTAELDAIAEAQPAETSVWVDPAAVVRNIEARYARAGRFETRVDVGEPILEDDVAILPVTIVEGAQATLNEVVLEGVSAVRLEGARAALDAEVGQPVGSTAASDAARRLEAFYDDRGYRDARIDAQLSRTGPEATLAVTVAEGPRHVIDDVRVSGVASTRPSLVSDAVTLKPGVPARTIEAETTRRNLYEIGAFRRVDVSFDPLDAAVGRSNQRPVLAAVRAEEPRRYQLRYGLALTRSHLFSNAAPSYSLGGTVEIRDRNFLGRGFQASAGLRYDRYTQSVALLFSQPAHRRRPIRTNVIAQVRDETTPFESGLEALLRTADLTLEQRWYVTPAVELTWGYNVGHQRLRLTVPDVLRVSFPGTLTGPTVGVTVDYRDDLFNPRSGWLHSSSVQWGIAALGSDLGYYRYLLRQQQYASLGPVTLGGNLEWGIVRGFSGTAPLSAIDLLFLTGGTYSVRGYSQNALYGVELEDLGITLGGTELLLLNGEVRFPIAGWFGGVFFVDAGNVFAGDVRLGDLASSTGLGLRIGTPLTTFRIDAGHPLTDRFGEPGWRWHFSVGQMF